MPVDRANPAFNMIGLAGENLVFLLSTPRAGSTLISAILNHHSRVLCPNEPWFLLGLHALYKGGNLTFAPYEHSGVEAALREFLTEDEFIEAVRAFAVTTYNRKLAMSGKSMFVDKTPRYHHLLPFLEKAFPEAKKVWLQRNPLDVAASLQTSWKLPVEQVFAPWFGPMAFDLTLGLTRFTEFFRGQSNTFELRYEDLVQAPEPALKRLCDFLGIACEPGLENYGADPKALEERKSKRMGDTKLFEHSLPHTQSLNRWESVLSREQVQKILDSIGARPFERMGYGDTVRQLRSMEFQFPSDAVVDERLGVFEECARTMPWSHREYSELKARYDELLADHDRLKAECERLEASCKKPSTGRNPSAGESNEPLLSKLARRFNRRPRRDS